jgi:acyl-CoA dehydrogenase
VRGLEHVGESVLVTVAVSGEAASFVVEVAAGTVASVALTAGTVISVTVVAGGVLLSAAGELLVFVPDAAVSLIRPADVWHPVWNTILPAAMPLIMSAYLGIADAAVEIARRAVAGRQDPHVFQLLGEMLNAYTVATDTIAAMYTDSDDLQFDNTDERSSRTLSRKTVAADALIDTVRLAIETTGGIGYTRSSDLERLYRDIHGCLFHPLGRAKQTRFSGRVALGLSPIG